MAGRGRGQGGRGFQMSSGDWVCPNPGCANVNFARRTQCNRCQTPQPEGSAPSPGSATKKDGDFRGPSGLFQAGDWTCNMCGNVNWERRQECNICKSPKSGMANTDERREGAGGGFDERQERVTSGKNEIGEDGYDEFGLRKKKVKASRAEKEAAALARLQQNYGAIYPTSDSRSAEAGSGSEEPKEISARKDRSVSPAARKTKEDNRTSRRSRSRDRNDRDRRRRDDRRSGRRRSRSSSRDRSRRSHRKRN